MPETTLLPLEASEAKRRVMGGVRGDEGSQGAEGAKGSAIQAGEDIAEALGKFSKAKQDAILRAADEAGIDYKNPAKLAKFQAQIEAEASASSTVGEEISAPNRLLWGVGKTLAIAYILRKLYKSGKAAQGLRAVKNSKVVQGSIDMFGRWIAGQELHKNRADFRSVKNKVKLKAEYKQLQAETRRLYPNADEWMESYEDWSQGKERELGSSPWESKSRRWKAKWKRRFSKIFGDGTYNYADDPMLWDDDLKKLEDAKLGGDPDLKFDRQGYKRVHDAEGYDEWAKNNPNDAQADARAGPEAVEARKAKFKRYETKTEMAATRGGTERIRTPEQQKVADNYIKRSAIHRKRWKAENPGVPESKYGSKEYPSLKRTETEDRALLGEEAGSTKKGPKRRTIEVQKEEGATKIEYEEVEGGRARAVEVPDTEVEIRLENDADLENRGWKQEDGNWVRADDPRGSSGVDEIRIVQRADGTWGYKEIDSRLDKYKDGKPGREWSKENEALVKSKKATDIEPDDFFPDDVPDTDVPDTDVPDDVPDDVPEDTGIDGEEILPDGGEANKLDGDELVETYDLTLEQELRVRHRERDIAKAKGKGTGNLDRRITVLEAKVRPEGRAAEAIGIRDQAAADAARKSDVDELTKRAEGRAGRTQRRLEKAQARQAAGQDPVPGQANEGELISAAGTEGELPLKEGPDYQGPVKGGQGKPRLGEGFTLKNLKKFGKASAIPGFLDILFSGTRNFVEAAQRREGAEGEGVAESAGTGIRGLATDLPLDLVAGPSDLLNWVAGLVGKDTSAYNKAREDIAASWEAATGHPSAESRSKTRIESGQYGTPAEAKDLRFNQETGGLKADSDPTRIRSEIAKEIANDPNFDTWPEGEANRRVEALTLLGEGWRQALHDDRSDYNVEIAEREHAAGRRALPPPPRRANPTPQQIEDLRSGRITQEELFNQLHPQRAIEQEVTKPKPAGRSYRLQPPPANWKPPVPAPMQGPQPQPEGWQPPVQVPAGPPVPPGWQPGGPGGGVNPLDIVRGQPPMGPAMAMGGMGAPALPGMPMPHDLQRLAQGGLRA